MTIARLLRIVRQRLRSLLRKEKLDAQLDEELAFHLEQLTNEKVASGLSVEEARRAARLEFGNPLIVAERSRDQRRMNWIHDLRQDLRYGLVMLRRSPGFTLVAMTSLALAIGGNAAVLGALDAVFVERLPFAHADRLVIIRTFAFDNPRQTDGASILEFTAWKERARTLEAIGASLSGQRLFHAEPDGMAAESMPGLSVTPGLFAMFGVAPLKGRLFDPIQDASGGRALGVIISHRLWRQRFGGASDILGRRVRIDGASRRIVGVMPPDFRYQGDDVACWIPMILLPNAARQPGAGRWFVVAARLKPGVTIAQAQADLDEIAAGLARESPDRQKGRGVRVQPLRDALYGWTKAPLLTLQASVALLLLIACTNVAGVFLARGTVRRREIALRTALGAGRGRIVRQLLAESVLLSAAGGLLGLLVAWCALAALTTVLGPPPAAPRIATIGLDLRILAVTALLSVLTAFASGLAPALATGKLDLASALNASAPASGTHPSGHRRRSLLVAAQIALALVLLVAAGLLSKSFMRLAGREINMDTKGVLSFEYGIPAASYAKQVGYVGVYPHFAIDPSPSGAIDRVFDRLRQLPGTLSVAGISYPPVNSLVLPTANVVLHDRGEGHAHQVAYFLVTPNFFSTVRTPFVRGRDFDARDAASAPWVAVVNESMARRFWPGEEAIGHRVRLDNGPDERERAVIGVVRNIPTRSNQIEPEPVIYASYLQQPSRYAGGWIGMFGQMTFVVRHAGDSAAVLSSARRAVSEIDPSRPIVSVGTIERHLTANRRESRNYVFALAAFALTATLLSAIGIYGVTAHAVNERTREIAVRRAFGAGKREIVTLVGRRVLAPILTGLILGLAGALAFTRLIATQLWNVTRTDPATYAGMSLLLASVALLACVAPTRRALAVDPTIVLRSE